MAKDKHNRNQNTRAAKKEAVLNAKRKSTVPLYAGITVMLCLVIAAAYYLVGGTQSGGPAASAQSEYTYPVSMFADGKARHFEYQTGEHTIKFFILKSSDGVIRAAFDACDVCWPAGKGYYQEGDQMVCRNCGRRFASLRINEVRGGCNPAPLTRNIVGDQLVIKAEHIMEGLQYFNFSGRT